MAAAPPAGRPPSPHRTLRFTRLPSPGTARMVDRRRRFVKCPTVSTTLQIHCRRGTPWSRAFPVRGRANASTGRAFGRRSCSAARFRALAIERTGETGEPVQRAGALRGTCRRRWSLLTMRPACGPTASGQLCRPPVVLLRLLRPDLTTTAWALSCGRTRECRRQKWKKPGMAPSVVHPDAHPWWSDAGRPTTTGGRPHATSRTCRGTVLQRVGPATA